MSKLGIGIRKILFTVLPRNHLGDYLCSQYLFFLNHKKLAHTKRPKTFNEHLLRMKLRDGLDPLRQFVADKEFVKLYVKAILGDEYNVPTLLLARTASDLDSTSIPDVCVIKPTHLSGPLILRRGGGPVSQEVIRGWFKKNHYRHGRETNYKYLVPKVIVEEFLDFEDGSLPKDYKLFCFGGAVKYVFVRYCRQNRNTSTLYSRSWQKLPFEYNNPVSEVENAPKNLAKMIEVAELLSKPFEFMRVDLYSNQSSIFVGELTSFPGNCNYEFRPHSFDRKIGGFFEDSTLEIEDLI